MPSTVEQSLEVLQATPGIFAALVAVTAPDVLARPTSGGGWSPLEVINHLLHVEEVVIATRIGLMLREDHPTFTPSAPAGPPAGATEILASWRAAREANLALVRSLSSEQLARAGRHHRYGDITIREHVVEWAYHDVDHLRQFLTALQIELYPDIGPFKALYPAPS